MLYHHKMLHNQHEDKHTTDTSERLRAGFSFCSSSAATAADEDFISREDVEVFFFYVGDDVG